MTRIAIVEGDGIGHEVIPVARSALELLHPEYDYFTVEVGYGMWERTGCPCADKEIREMKDADAILFGAITTPPMKDYQSVVLRIRKALDLYANLRPVTGDGFDIMIVRENQLTPTHFHHHKMEDIINRGGGNLVIRLWNATTDEGLAETPVTVSADGVRVCGEWKFRVPFDDPRCLALFKMAGKLKLPVVLHLDVQYLPDPATGAPVYQRMWYGGNVGALGFGDWVYPSNAPGARVALAHLALIPVVGTANHPLEVAWSAHDPSGIRGFSYVWDAVPATEPDRVVETAARTASARSCSAQSTARSTNSPSAMPKDESCMASMRASSPGTSSALAMNNSARW